MSKNYVLGLIFIGLFAACTVENNDMPNVPRTDVNQPPADTTMDTNQPDTSEPIADLIVNEIMYAPKAVYDDKGEWIEIYNRGSNTIDLKGWALRDNSFDKHTINQSLSIEPGGYVVLGNNADTASNGGYTADYMYTNFQLRDLTGDSVQLVDSMNRLIDTVSFKVSTPWPEKIAGVSIERISTDMSGTAPGSWTHATATYGDGDKGTPGQPNGAPTQTFSIDPDIKNWQSTTSNGSLYFAPDDFLEDRVLEQLLEAQESINMAFFNVRLDEILDTLIALQEEGIAIKILLDKRQQDLEYNTMGEDMLQAGLDVTLIDNQSATDSTMHHKYTVIDNKLVMMGSANYSWTAFNKSDEDLLIVEDTEIAERLTNHISDMLNEDWQNKSKGYETNTPIQVWMGPGDDPHKILLNALGEAQNSILLAVFQINYNPLIEALIDAKNNGCSVIVILDKKQSAQEEDSAYEALSKAGIDVFLMEKTNSEFSEMHSKFVVIDNKRVLMGSYNWTALASFFNNETLIDIQDSILAHRSMGKFSTMLASFDNADVASLGGLVTPMEVTFSIKNISLDSESTLRIQSIGGGPFQSPQDMNGNSLTVTLDRGTTMTYRYQVISPSGQINESGINHVLHVPYWSDSLIIEDVFLL